MSNDLLTKWLAHYDPIHRGWTLDGIANAVCTTNGFGFPRIRGGYNLRRSQGGVPSASSPMVGAAGADADSIVTFPWIVHAGGQDYLYRLTAVGGGGVENWTEVVCVEARFNNEGVWRGRRPNGPTDVRLVPLAGGRFAVRWTYLPAGQQVAPTEFNLYTLDYGEIDYGSIERVASYQPGRIHYEVITAPLEDGEWTGWAVRAHADGHGEEENEVQVFGWARCSGPPINPTVRVTCH